MARVLKASRTKFKLKLAWFLIGASYIYIVCASTSSNEYMSFSLTHRDAHSSPLRSLEADPADLAQGIPMRDFIAAGRALRGRLNKQRKLLDAAAPGDPLVGNLSYGEDTTVGDFFLTVPVGFPSQNMIFLVDTGSELTWTQCSPCPNCTNTTAPRFAYSQSSSFLAVGCDPQLCVNTTAVSSSCSITTAAQCRFKLSYGDGSVVGGFLSIDSFDLGPVFSNQFIFGCADFVDDTEPTNSSGLMGLDAGVFSFTSQLFASNPAMPRKFAYCLPDRIKSLNAPGRIEFGSYAEPAGVMYTPMASPNGQYYFVALEAISVGETIITVDMAAQVLLGGGTIFDSGSAVTSLVKSVYDEMVREMMTQTAALAPFNSTDDGGSDLCYRAPLMNAEEPPAVPSISMHFAGGVELQLGPASILFAYESDDTSTVFCLAFESTLGIRNIIGNYQQQNYWVEYNLQTSSLGLAQAQCANFKLP